jgi:predicted kinase
LSADIRIFAMMVGLPGAGKTWLRQKAFFDALVICPDDGIGYTKDKPWTPHAAKNAWREADESFARALTDGCADLVVFDATNVSAKRRRKYVTQAVKAGMQTVAVYCRTGKSVCTTRNAARSEHRRVPENVIDRMCGNLEVPCLDEGFQVVATIDCGDRAYSFHESMECSCGDAMRKRFCFLWDNAEHNSLTVVRQ